MRSKGLKKVLAVITAVTVLGTAGAAYAATYRTPAEIVSSITGQTTDTVAAERAEGKTYGAIADEAGKLDEFKAQMLEQKKALLDQRVKDGTLTQERADAIYNAIKDRQALCGGTGTGIGSGCGAGAGGCGLGRGMGMGFGGGFNR